MAKADFSENPVCKLFGIEFPVVQAGMVWCSGWRLAAAVSNAGGLGLIGAGSMDAALLREHVRKCKAATSRPFGVNIPLLYRHAAELFQVVLEEKVPIVFTSAGNPKTWTAQLKAEGLKVVHVVSNVKFALKAEAAGVDAIVAEGFEAGGHNGREEITTFCLIPQVRAATNLPLIAAGGIGNGAGMMAAMALGADGVQIGTRFVATNESSAHENFKQVVRDLPEDGTMLALKAITPVRLVKNKFYQELAALEAKGADLESISAHLGRGRAKKGMFEGDMEEGELEIGQVAALVKDIKPAAEVLQEILTEYLQLRQEISATKGRF
jgi:enoyl-[acyl-carrier protein] reductase II